MTHSAAQVDRLVHESVELLCATRVDVAQVEDVGDETRLLVEYRPGASVELAEPDGGEVGEARCEGLHPELWSSLLPLQ